MTGLWLISYILLWAVVIIVCLLLIGVLRQVGMLQSPSVPSSASPPSDVEIPTIENDGPPIGSLFPDIAGDSINGFGVISLADVHRQGAILLMFLSPMCEDCQHVVEPINAIAAERDRGVYPIAIVRADKAGCEAFDVVFPLHVPLICDSDRSITKGFGVHRSPFGLLYDGEGLLVRKGVIHGREEFLALLGDETAPTEACAHIVPALRVS